MNAGGARTGRPPRRRVLALALVGVMLQLLAEATHVQPAIGEAAVSPETSWRPPTGVRPLHRIGVRTMAGRHAEFFDTVTGRAFVPRGNNYIRLDPKHSTFSPAKYDPDRVEVALREMQRHGYNVVRVYLNSQVIGGSLERPGVDVLYMSNVLDFLARANAHGLYVMLSSDWLPSNYASIVGASPPPAKVEGINGVFMTPGFIEAARQYWTDVITAIKFLDPSLLSTVFSYDIWAEPFFQSDQQPFSLTSGFVTTADGGTYDMSNAASRQLAADNAARYWANQVVAAVKRADPQALTVASLFSPKAVGRSGYDGVQPNRDVRAPLRMSVLAESALDYVDLHTYPTGASYRLKDDLDSAELGATGMSKPRLIGEFGALKSYYPEANDAAPVLADHQVGSCAYGVKGWLLWTWDAGGSEQPHFWNALDANGEINSLLAPIHRPDACSGIGRLQPTIAEAP